MLEAAACAAVLLSGCAYVGDPKPPTLDIPQRVTDLRAIEYGAAILVGFTLPPLTTEGLGLSGVESIELRATAGASEHSYQVPAAETGAVRYEFPAKDWVGREVTLNVRATGPKGKTSDWSNSVLLNVGPPLPAPTNLRAVAVPEGVRLTWNGAPGHYWIFRGLNDAAPAKNAESDTAEYLDTTVDYGAPYKYFVQAVGGALRQSEISEVVGITPVDTFPPAVPSGLSAVSGVNAIELAWERNTESDFTSYYIYRSVDGGPFERIAGSIVAPTYSDRAVETGRKYAYAVTAIDAAGNESARSMVVEATAQ